jgi:rfaE bifunctional protein nucleotidyltransferase chain/domain
MLAIDVQNVTKTYRRYARRKQFATLKSALLSGSLISDLRADETFLALQDVSFTVPKGSTFGIIGSNGSGKSTMLKLVAGITKPTTGTVSVQGRISALIELGAGFHPEISGRENVFINGIMLGLSKKEVARRFDEIVEFAELREFIDAPVKTYSSGMYMRLGFAVAVHVDPDVLLIDEVLAVGDEAFTHKCLDKFAEFRRRGNTILLVTHSLNLIERFCDSALWLDHGRPRAIGDPRRVVDAYLTDVEHSEERTLAAGDRKLALDAEQSGSESAPHPEASAVSGAPGAEGQTPDGGTAVVEGRWGSREVEILAVTLKDRLGHTGHVFQSGESMSIHLTVRSAQAITDFAFGIGLFNSDGICCYGTNTCLEELVPEQVAGEGEVVFHIEALDLVEGTYKLDVAAHKRDGYPYDYHRLLYTFRVKSRTADVGIYRPHHRWTFSPNIRWRTGSDPVRLANRWRSEGKRIVFTNGVFDLLHPGHLRYLQEARLQGDVLVVAINSDRSVRAIKGPDRPVVPEGERAEVLAALTCVDAVVVFDEDTPQDVVAAIQPDILVKGADWAADRVIGREIVEARGGQVVRIPVVEGYSTSGIIEKVRTSS